MWMSEWRHENEILDIWIFFWMGVDDDGNEKHRSSWNEHEQQIFTFEIQNRKLIKICQVFACYTFCCSFSLPPTPPLCENLYLPKRKNLLSFFGNLNFFSHSFPSEEKFVLRYFSYQQTEKNSFRIKKNNFSTRNSKCWCGGNTNFIQSHFCVHTSQIV